MMVKENILFRSILKGGKSLERAECKNLVHKRFLDTKRVCYRTNFHIGFVSAKGGSAFGRKKGFVCGYVSFIV
jgi:hypothetical protein